MAPPSGNGDVSAHTERLRQYGGRVLSALQAAGESPGFTPSSAAKGAVARMGTAAQEGGWKGATAGQQPENVRKAMNFGYVGGLPASTNFWSVAHANRLNDAQNFRNQMARGYETLGKGGYYCANELERSDGLNARQITGSVLRDREKPTKSFGQGSPHVDPKRPVI